MKKLSILQKTSLFICGVFLTTAVFQCRKAGDLAKNLDRSFTGSADSTVYASFYDENTISTADQVPDVNDVITYRGVKTIVHEYCGTSNCHGGPISPKFDTYSEIMKYISPGNPQSSKLWEYITTNNFDKAMPPVASNHEMNTTDKGILYNWILNGAKERPDLADFRPAAMRIINDGCGSANCHNQATATGGWARAGYAGTLSASDTTLFTYINPATGSATVYCLLSNETKRNQVWNAYKDSVKKFYSDTVAFASFRPWIKFSSPRSAASTRGPLQTYDDVLLDIMYPKSIRSSNSVQYTNGSGTTFYVSSNYLNATSSMVSRIDSTVVLANPYTGVFASSPQADMAYGDGGLKAHEIALIKAWYFADPNVPDVWKYGVNNAGIFKYRKTGKIIKK